MKKNKAILLILFCIAAFISISDIIPRFVNRYNAKQLKSIMTTDSNENVYEAQSAYERLHSINPDTVGWIRIPDTAVDYAMVQCDNNQTYIENDFYGNKSKYGTIFIDAYCKINRGFFNQNTTVYGHNMKDGQMFGSLKKYRELGYYQQNPIIETQLNDAESAQWKIFSVFITNAYPAQDDGNVFPYRQRDFDTQQDFVVWVDECKKRSLLNIPVDIQPSDRILTLSTCTYEFEEARLVVMARRVRDGEESGVGPAEVNHAPLFPKAYRK